MNHYFPLFVFFSFLSSFSFFLLESFPKVPNSQFIFLPLPFPCHFPAFLPFPPFPFLVIFLPFFLYLFPSLFPLFLPLHLARLTMFKTGWTWTLPWSTPSWAGSRRGTWARSLSWRGGHPSLSLYQRKFKTNFQNLIQYFFSLAWERILAIIMASGSKDFDYYLC